MSQDEELIREMRRLLREELGRERKATDGDDDALDLQVELEMLGETAMRLGTAVFSLDWDSGGPGAGAGTETVYRVGDHYLYLSSTFGWEGPYETLDDAYGCITVTGATQSIWSGEWDEDEIVARIQLYDGPPVIHINGSPWPFETLEHAAEQDACGKCRVGERYHAPWKEGGAERSLRFPSPLHWEPDMSESVSWNLQVDVQDGRLDEARALMSEMVASTRQEPGALVYEWFLSPDGQVCHLCERYADSAAALEHLESFGANFAERFLACFAPAAFYVYGDPSDEVREVLDGFGAVYLGPFGGFAR
jgi:quinol monooxygenase YgiN